MSWRVEHLKYLEKMQRKALTERVDIANRYLFEQRILHNIERRLTDGESVADMLSTPIGEMNAKERDAYYELFKDDGDIPDEYAVYMGKNGRVYDIRVLNIRLIDIIYKYLREHNDTLDSDSFDVTPYFSIINGTDIISGFMTFTRDPLDDHSIIEVGLFSFDVNNKEWGKQVWEDFDECIIDYLSRGYKIKFVANKTNKACKHYDDLIRNLNGSKRELKYSWEYRLG